MVTQKKLMRLEDLEAIKQKVTDERRRFAYHAMICSGTSCQASESLRLRDTLGQELLRHDLSGRVYIVETGCMGFCAVGPLMRVDPDDYFYQKLALPDISEIVKEHFLKGRPVKRLMYRDPVSGRIIPQFSKIPFIEPQQLVVLHNRGIINPEKIDDYIWRHGYQATFKALTTMTPAEIISEVKASGLRGRGGGGFPIGIKWELCAASKGATKYILCNADEGDPGALMDRSVLDADPHAILEGMIIAAKAIDAHHGYIYCRAEYPIAVQRLNIAIRQAGEYGLLGKDIFGTGFDLDIEIYRGAGAIMGSGGMIIMDEDTCMVDMARFFMDFCRDESCGKCTACRIGTKRMFEILERICRGQGREGDIGLLEDLAQSIKDTALCGLGQTAPNPVLSTIRYFRDEYDAHIKDKRCPAVVCSELFDAPCQHMCPVGMDIPAYIALVRARRYDDAYKVLTQTNPFPVVCGRVCGHPCQRKCRRSQLDAPLAIKNLKRFITDHATRPGLEPIPVSQPEKIAVIGAGPAGLTMALEMKKRGYSVTVFEQLTEAGGMLRWGIPAYRLPRKLLDQEIRDILNTGVILRTNTCIGKDIGFEELQQTFGIIFIAAGAQKSMPLGISGDDAEGVFGAVEWLREYNS